MVNPEDIAERFWSLAQKPGEEARREQLFLDDVIHKARVERELEARLDGVETALGVGAGTGRFSLWLAARGVRVTHVDVSAGMIEHARRDAAEAGLGKWMTFQRGRLADISEYAPRQFDLVICSDAPVSYVYPEHVSAIRSLVRVCSKAIVLSVSSRMGYVPLALNPKQKEPYFANPDSDDPLVCFYRETGRESLADLEAVLEDAWRALRAGLMTSPENTDRAFQA